MTTKVKIGTKRYVVHHDDRGVTRIEYTDAVRGTRCLDLTGRTAKSVLRKFQSR